MIGRPRPAAGTGAGGSGAGVTASSSSPNTAGPPKELSFASTLASTTSSSSASSHQPPARYQYPGERRTGTGNGEPAQGQGQGAASGSLGSTGEMMALLRKTNSQEYNHPQHQQGQSSSSSPQSHSRPPSQSSHHHQGSSSANIPRSRSRASNRSDGDGMGYDGPAATNGVSEVDQRLGGEGGVGGTDHGDGGQDFCNVFWSEGGFERLMVRMREGDRTVEELRAFLKERADIEEDFAKRILKLATKQRFGELEGGQLGTAIGAIRSELDSSARSHLTTSEDVKKNLIKKVDEFIKEREGQRRSAQANIEKSYKMKVQSLTYVQRAQEKYRADCLLINGLHAQESLSQGKDLDKVNAKMERAQVSVQQTERDYQTYLQALKERTMKWTSEWKNYCDLCQDQEEDRIDFVKATLWEYINGVSQNCLNDDESCEIDRQALEICEPDRDVRAWASHAGTGGRMDDPPPWVDYRNGEPSNPPQQTYKIANFMRSSARPQQKHVPRPPHALPNVKPGSQPTTPKHQKPDRPPAADEPSPSTPVSVPADAQRQASVTPTRTRTNSKPQAPPADSSAAEDIQSASLGKAVTPAEAFIRNSRQGPNTLPNPPSLSTSATMPASSPSVRANTPNTPSRSHANSLSEAAREQNAAGSGSRTASPAPSRYPGLTSSASEVVRAPSLSKKDGKISAAAFRPKSVQGASSPNLTLGSSEPSKRSSSPAPPVLPDKDLVASPAEQKPSGSGSSKSNDDALLQALAKLRDPTTSSSVSYKPSISRRTSNVPPGAIALPGMGGAASSQAQRQASGGSTRSASPAQQQGPVATMMRPPQHQQQRSEGNVVGSYGAALPGERRSNPPSRRGSTASVNAGGNRFGGDGNYGGAASALQQQVKGGNGVMSPGGGQGGPQGQNGFAGVGARGRSPSPQPFALPPGARAPSPIVQQQPQLVHTPAPMQQQQPPAQQHMPPQQQPVQQMVQPAMSPSMSLTHSQSFRQSTYQQQPVQNPVQQQYHQQPMAQQQQPQQQPQQQYIQQPQQPQSGFIPPVRQTSPLGFPVDPSGRMSRQDSNPALHHSASISQRMSMSPVSQTSTPSIGYAASQQQQVAYATPQQQHPGSSFTPAPQQSFTPQPQQLYGHQQQPHQALPSTLYQQPSQIYQPLQYFQQPQSQPQSQHYQQASQQQPQPVMSPGPGPGQRPGAATTLSQVSSGSLSYESNPMPMAGHQRAPSSAASPANGRNGPPPPTGQYSEAGHPILFYVRALHDYQATIPQEFSFQADDIIAVFEADGSGWWQGELLDENRRVPGKHTFPSTFTTLLE